MGGVWAHGELLDADVHRLSRGYAAYCRQVRQELSRAFSAQFPSIREALFTLSVSSSDGCRAAFVPPSFSMDGVTEPCLYSQCYPYPGKSLNCSFCSEKFPDNVTRHLRKVGLLCSLKTLSPRYTLWLVDSASVVFRATTHPSRGLTTSLGSSLIESRVPVSVFCRSHPLHFFLYFLPTSPLCHILKVFEIDNLCCCCCC